MRPARVVIAVIVGLAGLVWMAQGLGVLPGTVMSGSIFWAIVGAALLVVAVAIIAVERRRSSAAPPPDAPPPPAA